MPTRSDYKNIKLSIVVIGFNVERYISKCLFSIAEQLSENIELIFVNDGSTDKTEELVCSIFSEFPDSNCRYLYQDNSGANRARIYGYKQAVGEYITFIDGDDWVGKNYLDTLMPHLDGENDIISFNFQTVFADKKIEINKNHECCTYKGKEFLEAVLEVRTTHYLWNKVYSMQFLEKVKFEKIPPITMGDDLAAHVRMGVKNPNVLNLSEVLYNYFRDGNSISGKPTLKTLEIVLALEDMEKILDREYGKNEYRDLIDYHYFRSFYFYVVRNKYKWTDVQKKIYAAWKERKVCLRKNTYIKRYMADKKKDMLLIKTYSFSPLLGRFVATIYLRLKGENK